MKILTEVDAEEFLEKEGFKVVDRVLIKKKKALGAACKLLDFPIVMKTSGKEIIHKVNLGGVRLNINSCEEALKNYKELIEIKGADEILIQRQISGKELIFGIKKAPEFGHVIVFGKGGSKVEEEKDVSFRIFPLDKKDAGEMIMNTKIGKTLGFFEKRLVVENLFLLSELIEKYPKIKELDINPFVLGKKFSGVLDARIVFE